MKPSSSFIARIALLSACWMAFPEDVRCQVETVLHSFGSVTPDGNFSTAPLVLGTNGNFYGTTQKAGSEGGGCVFEIGPSGTFTILHSFLDGSVTNDGANPYAGLILGSDGNFYGTTFSGGSVNQGTVFKITPQGAVTILHSFRDGSVANDGNESKAPLIQGGDGNFYGTTYGGGTKAFGTVFKITPQGTETILHNFDDGSVTDDGVQPVGGLIQGGDGNFYGTTENSNYTALGTFFEITPGGTLTILHGFDDGTVTHDGDNPLAGLIQGQDGNFYGTTEGGGVGDDGTVFKITPQGAETILHSFHDGSLFNDGTEPVAPLVQGTDGNFYGTTEEGTGVSPGMGCLFAITPQGQFTLLHSFGDGSVTSDGSTPMAGLVQGANGILYGTTQMGGTVNHGTVFALAPAVPFISSSTAASGSVSLPFSYQTTATNHPTGYAATNLPDGLSMNSTTGLISGTPTTVETNTVTLTVTTATSSSNISLTITIGALPVPVITSILTAYGAVDTAFTYSTVATNTTTSYSAMGLTGTGLSIDPSMGIITGSPNSVGTIPVTLTATNAAGASASVALSIQILAAPPTLSQEYYVVPVPEAASSPLSILQAFDGNYYGVSSAEGVVYKMTEQGVVSVFYKFTTSTGINGPTSLIQAADGNFYGTTVTQAFKLTPLGQVTILHQFGFDTDIVVNPLVQGFDGNFYGTTEYGGPLQEGTAFKITPQGAFTLLHTFGDGSVTNDGLRPSGALVQGSDGNFYGTTQFGGTLNSGGSVFEITPQGTVAILHGFDDGSVINDGITPVGGLIQGDDGNFYGTTQDGGSASAGTVFEITPQRMVTILHSFGSVTNDGANPMAPLIQGYDGNFYGTTYSGGTADEGTIFQITPQEVVTILHNFGDNSVSNDGNLPTTPLIQSAAGNFYGVTNRGGVSNAGTIYSIEAMQTPVHVPIYTGSAYEESSVLSPFSFTPKAAFGVSGLGIENGNSVHAQTGGSGIMAALVSLLPQSIRKAFSTTNWTLTGTLPNYLTFDPTSATISGTPVQGGIFTVVMTPINAIGPGTPMTVTLYIDVPPGISSAVTATTPVGMPFSYQIEAVPPADSYGATYLPGWLSADPVAGIISGTPPSAGTYVFDAIAANLSGQTVQPVTLTVTGASSSGPTITSATTANSTVGSPFTYQIATANPATSYTALALPTGLVFDATAGSIFGTPTQVGTSTIPLSATNANGSYASALTLTVAALVAPTINSSLFETAIEGASFSYQIPATGVVSTYTETGTLPTGLTFNSMTGVISGIPTATGTFAVMVSVGNIVGTNMATLTFDVGTATNFNQWEAGYDIVGSPETATPENDNVPNLLKFLYDIDPTVPLSAADHAALPVMGTTTSGGISYVTLTYRQYAFETGLTINVQTSPDLQTWTTVNPPDLSLQVGTDPMTGDPLMEVGVKANGTGKQFLRLNVTSP